MALSDYEQMVLREMEIGLRADTTRFAAAGGSVNAMPRRYFAVSIALVIAGVAAMAAGLDLADDLGTGLGVIGFVLIVGSCWTATHLLAPVRRWAVVRSNSRAESPADRPRL